MDPHLPPAWFATRSSSSHAFLCLITRLFVVSVMFCERWYAREALETSLSIKHAMIVPVLFYVLWQCFYSLKTDVLDKNKLQSDKDMLTSARWLGEIKPHPVYLMLVRRGYKWSPSIVLPGFQLFYTIGTLIPAWLAFHYFWAHVLILCTAFAFACWYGAQYYFEVFSMNYSKRLQKQIDETKAEEKQESQKISQAPTAAPVTRYGPNSWLSFASFFFFFILFMSCFVSMIVYFCS